MDANPSAQAHLGRGETSWDRPRTNSVTIFNSLDRPSTGAVSFGLTAGRVSAWMTRDICFDETEISFATRMPLIPPSGQSLSHIESGDLCQLASSEACAIPDNILYPPTAIDSALVESPASHEGSPQR